MLVNGKKPEGDLIEAVKNLPSSFPDYNSRPLYQATEQATNFSREAVGLLTEGKPNDAIKKLEESVKSNNPKFNNDNNQFMSYHHNNMGTAKLAIGNHKEAIDNYEKSIDIGINTKLYDYVEETSKTLAQAHKKNGTLDGFAKKQQDLLDQSLNEQDQQKQLKARLNLGAVARINGQDREAVQHYDETYKLIQGKLDYEAHRIEQHEIGFSDREKIGTDNIQQCVVAIIHDPISKKTALAHIDRSTNPESLSEMINERFKGNTKLDAYLVGGRDRTQQVQVSNNNIEKVINQLSKHSNIDIKASSIADAPTPSAIVFDPQTGKLEHAVPGKDDSTTPLRVSKLSV